MRFLKVIIGLAFVGLAASSAQLHATTTTSYVPASCSWSLVSSSVYGKDEICKDGAATVATRSIQYGAIQYTTYSCSITNVYTPYSRAGGTCENPSFSKAITTEVPSCGPNSGKVWGTYRAGLGTYIPYSQIDSFCGSCGYTSTLISTDQGGSTYQATCK